MSEFYNRLEQACNDHPAVPAKNAGRQIHIAKIMNVSREASRKWFAGESVPRAAAMKKLAGILGVPHAWLAVGTTASESFSIREIAKLQDSGIYAFMSFLLQRDNSVGFTTSALDPSDITAVVNGSVNKYTVISGVLEGNITTVPPRKKDEDTIVIAAISRSENDWGFDFVDVSTFGDIEPFKLVKSGKTYIKDKIALQIMI